MGARRSNYTRPEDISFLRWGEMQSYGVIGQVWYIARGPHKGAIMVHKGAYGGKDDYVHVVRQQRVGYSYLPEYIRKIIEPKAQALFLAGPPEGADNG